MSGTKGVRRVNIRFEPLMGEAGEFLLRCDDCVSSGQATAYFPLTLEFWAPMYGLQRCRACHNQKRRISDHRTIEFRRARDRRYYREHHAKRIAYANAYTEANREHINALRRERYARKKGKIE